MTDQVNTSVVTEKTTSVTKHKLIIVVDHAISFSYAATLIGIQLTWLLFLAWIAINLTITMVLK